MFPQKSATSHGSTPDALQGACVSLAVTFPVLNPERSPCAVFMFPYLSRPLDLLGLLHLHILALLLVLRRALLLVGVPRLLRGHHLAPLNRDVRAAVLWNIRTVMKMETNPKFFGSPL